MSIVDKIIAEEEAKIPKVYNDDYYKIVLGNNISDRHIVLLKIKRIKKKFRRLPLNKMSVRDCYEEIYHDETIRGLRDLELSENDASVRGNKIAIRATWVYYNLIRGSYEEQR